MSPIPEPACPPALSRSTPGVPQTPAAHASGLSVRKLEIDLSEGFARHWHGGDAFLSQQFNALSMVFPVGEQSFIDSVREGIKLLPRTPENARLHACVAQFIGQEATHRHLHGLYNAQLQQQGLVNRWQYWVGARLERARLQGASPLQLLATTIAYEHLTAILADYLLRHNRTLDQAEPKMRTLWRWHAAEETEHRAVSYDLYLALGGSYAMRMRYYVKGVRHFMLELLWQTVLNLWHDGMLFRLSTGWSASKLYLGRNGLVWRCTLPLLAYFRRDFHPDQESQPEPSQQSWALAQRWLRENASRFRVVR